MLTPNATVVATEINVGDVIPGHGTVRVATRRTSDTVQFQFFRQYGKRRAYPSPLIVKRTDMLGIVRDPDHAIHTQALATNTVPVFSGFGANRTVRFVKPEELSIYHGAH